MSGTFEDILRNKGNLTNKEEVHAAVKEGNVLHSKEQEIILGHMGYAACKLWNVANYEKRNHKELGMQNYPDWYEQKKRLKENFFYKNLPSQTAQDVLQQFEEAKMKRWISHF